MSLEVGFLSTPAACVLLSLRALWWGSADLSCQLSELVAVGVGKRRRECGCTDSPCAGSLLWLLTLLSAAAHVEGLAVAYCNHVPVELSDVTRSPCCQELVVGGPLSVMPG